VADRPVPSKITDLAPKVIDRAAAIGDTQSTFAPGRSETSVVTLRADSVAVSVPSEEAARLPDCSSASASDGVVPFDVGDTLHEMRLRMKEFLADTDFQAGENGYKFQPRPGENLRISFSQIDSLFCECDPERLLDGA
jgi:hypothetical protein